MGPLLGLTLSGFVAVLTFALQQRLPLRMATVFGGVSERPQIEALRSGVDLVVAQARAYACAR